jgi:hypothetical protein
MVPGRLYRRLVQSVDVASIAVTGELLNLLPYQAVVTMQLERRML